MVEELAQLPACAGFSQFFGCELVADFLSTWWAAYRRMTAAARNVSEQVSLHSASFGVISL